MNPDIQSQMKAQDPDAVLADMEARRVTGPIELNETQESLCELWAANDGLWTTQETVESNLRAFARSILNWDTQGIKSNPQEIIKPPSSLLGKTLNDKCACPSVACPVHGLPNGSACGGW